MNIGCAILAGGKSSRMGTDKALLAIEGTNFITKIAGELVSFNERIVSRGTNSDLSDLGWQVISDIYEHHGPLGGIHAALSFCKSDALMFVTCDMPFFKHELAEYICNAYFEPGMSRTCAHTDSAECVSNIRCGYDAIVAVTPDGRIHPLCGIYHKSSIPVLEKLLSENKNKVMMALDQMHVNYLPIPDDMAHMLSNINTTIDYQAIAHK